MSTNHRVFNGFSCCLRIAGKALSNCRVATCVVGYSPPWLVMSSMSFKGMHRTGLGKRNLRFFATFLFTPTK
eukprot:11097023-Alexandrium_andersonii.AAC.1